MGSYLEVCGWSGCRKIPVTVIGETAEEFRVEAIESTFLPGRGTLKKGQSAYVPKTAVTLESGEMPSPHATC
jgi:hypothetical protein